jgi:hypothetical protein
MFSSLLVAATASAAYFYMNKTSHQLNSDLGEYMDPKVEEVKH